MKAIILTSDELMNDEGRLYNPSIWNQNIERYNKYTDVVFYKVAACSVYSYNRYFVEYTLPEGLRLLNSFGYSSSLTNGGFFRVDKAQVTKEGKTFIDFVNLAQDESKMEEARELLKELESSNIIEITFGKFYDEKTGESHLISGETKEAYKFMLDRSIKYGLTFSKG